jgi:G patch domain-containing protein 1
MLSLGWTPSTFKSSRTDRAAKKAAKPEDFMDEEDLAELRESRQYVSTHDQPADAQAWQNQDVPE